MAKLMRVLFCCLPAHGHLYPVLPLAIACREAGHEVRFATGEQFQPRLGELGFAGHTVGVSVHTAIGHALRAEPALAELPGWEQWRVIAVVFGRELARHTLVDLLPILAKDPPDLVVYEESNGGAAAAARLCGVPAIGHALGRQLPESLRAPGLEQLRGVWAEFSSAAMPDLFTENAFLDIAPPSLRDYGGAISPAARIPLRPVQCTEPGIGLPDWITRDRATPLVYLTLGTFAHNAMDTLTVAAAGLGRLDLDVVVTVGPHTDPAALGKPPSRVRVYRFLPHEALLPHVGLVVHHGGSGTMLGAFGHGLPQLVLPFGADQFFNAQAILDAGAGRRLLPDQITPDAVADAATNVLVDARYRIVAQIIAEEIAAMPAPNAVVPELARWSRRRSDQSRV